MSIDMTGLERLGSVGIAKLLTSIPRGQAKEGIQLAFKIKKAGWVKGDYGHRYHLDVVIRTLDMQTVLASELWKVYPSMLPHDVIEAIDTDTYDDVWFLVRTVVNENSKADPKKTKLHLIDTQEGINAHTGPSKPAADTSPVVLHTGSAAERGQPGPGEEPLPIPSSPGNPLPDHPAVHCACAPLDRKIAVIPRTGAEICLECGGMVG